MTKWFKGEPPGPGRTVIRGEALKPAEVRQLLIKELRGGRYKQAIGQLSYRDVLDEQCFCVMGVLCDLYMEHADNLEGWLWEYADLYLGYRITSKAGGNYLKNPPFGVTSWIDMSEVEMEKLMKLNDEGRSFEELADVLETGWVK